MALRMGRTLDRMTWHVLMTCLVHEAVHEASAVLANSSLSEPMRTLRMVLRMGRTLDGVQITNWPQQGT
jgi:hypothetical protein